MFIADGHWGRWSTWNCDAVECSLGSSRRTRLCNDPAPNSGGAYCSGNDMEETRCNRGCPRNCDFDSTDFCGYSLTGVLARTNGSTPSPGTGPTTDVSGTHH